MPKNAWDAPHTLHTLITLEQAALTQKKKEIELRLAHAQKQLEQQMKLLEKATCDH